MNQFMQVLTAYFFTLVVFSTCKSFLCFSSCKKKKHCDKRRMSFVPLLFINARGKLIHLCLHVLPIFPLFLNLV